MENCIEIENGFVQESISASTDADFLLKESGGDIPPSSQMMQHGERVKRKATRPSSKLSMANGNEPEEGGIDLVKVTDGTTIENGTRPSLVKRTNKNSRRPRGRYGRGLAKKGGAGGKGTWGKPGSELVDVEESVDDPSDPNYDSDSQDVCKFEAITPPLNDDEIEKHVTSIVIEYFEHGDTEEVCRSLDEINLGDNEYQVLVIAVTLAMERKASNREMTSVLISDLYGGIIFNGDIENGFDILLRSLPDLILDTPNAPTVLGNFIARAVADDCIPPKYVQNGLASIESSLTRTAMEHASALLNMKHGLVRLDSVWGVSGGMRPVKYLIRQIQLLLREYVSSGDIEEATRCLKDLEVPHFHHEFVFETVVLVIEDMSDRTLAVMCALLKSLCSSAVVTLDQLKNGMKRVYEEMSEISIDVPLAFNILEKFVAKCANDGFMPQELVKSIPNRGRKRFVSEGDGGKLKDDDNV